MNVFMTTYDRSRDTVQWLLQWCATLRDCRARTHPDTHPVGIAYYDNAIDELHTLLRAVSDGTIVSMI